jgi:hypothetical protein
LGALHELWERYRDRVAFLVVYVREAHPEDGWVVADNRDEDIEVLDPTTDDERADVATTCALRLAIRMPVVIDGVDDAVCRAYGAYPDRMALVGKGGCLRYLGNEGPFGFIPEELESAIVSELGKSS